MRDCGFPAKTNDRGTAASSGPRRRRGRGWPFRDTNGSGAFASGSRLFSLEDFVSAPPRSTAVRILLRERHARQLVEVGWKCLRRAARVENLHGHAGASRERERHGDAVVVVRLDDRVGRRRVARRRRDDAVRVALEDVRAELRGFGLRQTEFRKELIFAASECWRRPLEASNKTRSKRHPLGPRTTMAFMRSVSLTRQLPTFRIVVGPSATNATDASVMAASGMSRQSTSTPFSWTGPPITVMFVGAISMRAPMDLRGRVALASGRSASPRRRRGASSSSSSSGRESAAAGSTRPARARTSAKRTSPWVDAEPQPTTVRSPPVMAAAARKYDADDASPSTKYLGARRSRRTIHVVAVAATRLRGIFASRPRRRRDPSAACPRSERTSPPAGPRSCSAGRASR